MHEHPSREQLAAFQGGHLSGADLAALSRHIEKCDVCCQVLRDIPDDAFVARLRDTNPPGSGDQPIAIRSPEENLPPELLHHPRYKIGRCLGAGGMGAVFLAEHRLMGRTVALKILHPGLLRHPRALERFLAEIKNFRRLSHPNIVQAFDADQAGQTHFLVMEFVDGISLDRLVARKGPLEISLACNFVRQAAKGLQHAHEAGVVHRDIKPHNLMLTRKGQIKILDFGLARVGIETRVELESQRAESRPGLTRLGDVMGTPEYMAPEQITDPRNADIRADLYSLGCTLFFLLTGQSPFKAESPLELMYAQQHHEPPRLSDLRPEIVSELEDIVDKLLVKQPEDRYASPAELIRVLAPFVKPTPAVTKPSTAPEPVPDRIAPPPVAQAPPRPETRAPSTPVASGQNLFLARCPFCAAGIRIPRKALGASIPCPLCSSYFTAVPVDQD